jgi:hypothetical protein
VYKSRAVEKFLRAHKARSQDDALLVFAEDEPLILYNEYVIPVDEPLLPGTPGAGGPAAGGDMDDMPMPDDAPSEEPLPSPEQLIIKVILSTATPDRANDVVTQEGFQLGEYMRNPQVLWCHECWKPPIAQALTVGLDTLGRLMATDLFMGPDLCKKSYKVYQMVRQRFLRTVSVGFVPLTWSYDESREGYNFLTQTLLEHSFCPIPMNPEALVELQARAANEEKQWLAREVEEALDTGGVLPWQQKRYARAREILSQERTLIAPPAANKQKQRAVPRDVSVSTAAADTAWSAPRLSDFTSERWAELSDTEKNTIAGHYAYATSLPPATFGDLSLPHHRASDGAIVWLGVVAAVQRLGQTSIPDNEIAAVQRHLGRHYKAFDKVPPWEMDEGKAWEAYQAMALLIQHEQDPETLGEAQRRFRQLDAALFGGAQLSTPAESAAMEAVLILED